jgi:GT2 family glycosyltransferase
VNDLKVIGLGLSRTGTTSLHDALNLLGYRCLHFVEPGTEPSWLAALENGLPPELAGYDALCDLPAALFHRAWLERYPEARFILTIRPESEWIKSMRRHHDASRAADPKWAASFGAEVQRRAYGSVEFDEARFLESYRRHNAAIEASIPRERLLVIRICEGEGWEKLCPFLGRTVPAMPFPHRDWIAENSAVAATSATGALEPLGSRPRVSVVINTLNRAHLLGDCLAGLERQTYENFEVIVVNGPSTDVTAALLESHRGRIRVADCATACIGRSRNIGVEAASGAIVAFTDDDAVPRPEWLARLVAPYGDATVAGVGGWVFAPRRDEMQWRICTATRAGFPSPDSPPPWNQYARAGADPFLYLTGCNMSFRREAIVAVGGFNENYTYGHEDTEIAARILDAGHGLVLVEDAVVDHMIAATDWRGEDGVVKDPRIAIRSQAIFAVEMTALAGRSLDFPALLFAIAERWKGWGWGLHQAGKLTADERTGFFAGIDEIVAEAFVAGPRRRRPRRISLPCTDDFLPFTRSKIAGASL